MTKIQASGRTLSTVFLTHAHPDHYLGFQIIQQAFPGAHFVTTADVLADFNASGTGAQATLDYLTPLFPAGTFASAIVTPTALSGSSVTIDGEEVDVIEAANAGEAAHNASLVLKNEDAIVTGDVLYNQYYLYLGECHHAGWITNLGALGTSYTTYYPGHGAATDASAIAADTTYINTVLPLMQAAYALDAGTAVDGGDPKLTAANASLQAKYPSYGSEFLLNFSDEEWLANCGGM